MENQFLLDLSLKYGLNSGQTTKVADVVHQCGFSDFEDEVAKNIATFICIEKLVDKPTDEIIENIKRADFLPL
jgi:hypothetical protein